jgi:hypothetical protein
MRGAATAIAAVCESGDFKAWEEDAKREFLEGLMDLDKGAALGTARRLLAEKSLLGGARQDESRTVAARVLGELRDVESRPLLEEIAQGRGRPELKEAANHALAKLNRMRRE